MAIANYILALVLLSVAFIFFYIASWDKEKKGPIITSIVFSSLSLYIAIVGFWNYWISCPGWSKIINDAVESVTNLI